MLPVLTSRPSPAHRTIRQAPAGRPGGADRQAPVDPVQATARDGAGRDRAGRDGAGPGKRAGVGMPAPAGHRHIDRSREASATGPHAVASAAYRATLGRGEDYGPRFRMTA